MKIALVGNPNSGKTTIFNLLTGSNQYVGNWPGVTVEKKEGRIIGHNDVILTDLPGVYSLSPYTLEEIVARDYLVDEKPDVIINLIDGSNIERNLYLTTQVLELGIPVVCAINMIDIVRKNGDIIDIKRLSEKLGVPFVEVSGLKNLGIEDLIEKSISAKGMTPAKVHHNFHGPVEHTLAHIEEACIHQLPDEIQRWYAIKIFERDKKAIEKLQIKEDVLKHIDNDIKLCEKEMDDDAESIITNERYLYVEDLLKGSYKKKNNSRDTLSDKIDKIVTSRWLGLPIFALVMFLVFFVSVSTVGAWATDWASNGVFGNGWNFFGFNVPGIPVIVDNFLTSINCNLIMKSLVLDGMIAGVGSVLGFVPQITLLFLFLSFLEGCGYMARVAFILDRIFKKFGLSGKSFIPILIGVGCGVPGIMASRTIENQDDRRMTIMTTTFIPCSAKTPIMAMIAGTVFNSAWWVAPSCYFLGFASIICSGIILKKTKLFLGEPSPFVMELPSYHMPTLDTIVKSIWERVSSFIKKAGTIILLASMIVWFLSNFGIQNGKVLYLFENEMDKSFLANIGNVISVIFLPLGFGTWQTTVATFTGLIAKENIVGTMRVLYKGGEFGKMMRAVFTPIAGYSFLAFNLLCAPCVAAIGAIKKEMNSTKWFLIAILYQCSFAYFVAFVIYQLGLAFTGGDFTVLTFLAIFMVAFFIYMLFAYKQKFSGCCGNCSKCGHKCT